MMIKKTFNTPYIKIVEVKNDIIATSDPTMGNAYTTGSHTGRISRRGENVWSDGEAVEDLDF